MYGLRWLALVLCVVLYGTAANATNKVALVIGNGAYQNATALPNPPNDAADMAAALEKLGFTVISGIDVNQAQMVQKVGDFEEAARDAEVTLFFYAGHGLQVNGLNYLVPIDAKLERPTSLQFETIETSLILNSMSGSGRTAIAFLDACRNNPLSRSFSRSLGKSRSVAVGQGLAAPTMASGGMIIGFSTAPGEVAADGEGRNSPFTAALLKNISTPGLEIQQLMTRVKADVYTATKETQEPWHNSSLRSEVFLMPVAAVVAATPVPAPVAEPSQAQPSSIEFEWTAVKDSENASALEAFMAKHSDDPLYVALADERLHRIQGNGGTAVAVVQAPATRSDAPTTGPLKDFDKFLGQALDIVNGTSDATTPLQVLKLLSPAAAPGAKTPKLNLKRLATAPTFAALQQVVSDIPSDFQDFATCRASNLSSSGCVFMAKPFSSAMRAALERRGLTAEGSPDFDVVKIDGSEDVVFATRPKSGDGEITIALALISPELVIKKSFLIDISKSRFGIDAGNTDTRFHVTGANIEESDIYLTLDSDFRCKNNAPIKRNAGIVLRASMDVLKVKWISPFNVSNANIVSDGVSLYTATVGSCAASYIYSLDKQTGEVNSRLKLPNGADKLMLSGNKLFVQHYPAASVYSFE
jgi:Caspase domain